MSDDKYAKGIRKTGFILESKVADALRRARWTVISNKYYEDDFEGSVREIDLLAYKVSEVQGVNVYTTLLISCKKNDVDVWALLARSINLKDPNSDWWPLHAWSNDKAVCYELAKPGMARKYHEDSIRLGVTEALSVPQYEVFAFQEMNRASGVPHNDKNIFAAVTSLLKAQAYELGALNQRKKKPSIYQFNLISVLESELFRLLVDGSTISQQQIESEHFISRYIIKKRETFSRIRFVTASTFKETLKDYGRLHNANCKWFDIAIDAFYENVLKDARRVAVLIKDFRSLVQWQIYWSAKQTHGEKIDFDSLWVEWNDEDDCAEITLHESESLIDSLNSHHDLNRKMSAALSKVYRYDGKVRFAVSEIPF